MAEIRVLAYWALFWLLNVVDKMVGGAHFPGWVETAPNSKIFASAGLGLWVADAGLIVAAALDLRFGVLRRSLVPFHAQNEGKARNWFLIGVLTTLGTFTFFSIDVASLATGSSCEHALVHHCAFMDCIHEARRR